MFYSHTQWITAPRLAPDNQMIFAVGDVHGCFDELSALQKLMQYQIDKHNNDHHTVVYLGDYIDRGPESKKTLEFLNTGIGRDIDEIFLTGNHEQFLLELLNLDPSLDRYFIDQWYENGGIATMESLNVSGYGRLLFANKLEELSANTSEALGSNLISFLRNLKSIHQIGEYVFVHAGIDPYISLEQQDFYDLLWMREPFLSELDGWDHDFCVVHGHSISAPTVLHHRIGVDVGCFKYGVLCALQIKNDLLRYIGVAKDPTQFYQEKLISQHNNWVWDEPIFINELLNS